MIVSRVEVTQRMQSIGFTGTREGLTVFQRGALMHTLEAHVFPEDMFETRGHYGDCIGADYEFFLIGKALGLHLVCHPPLDGRFRAFTHEQADEVRPMKNYLARNWDIAEESQLLVATPKEMTEPKSHRGSGTWTTVGYARFLERKVMLIWPDGRIE